ncbi:hypothetical protein KV692_04000 [Xanthomonas euvesicatoria pv. physalidis]|nr:hypothetical protein [Xanthomonas euvesicatoria pv. physalidis]
MEFRLLSAFLLFMGSYLPLALILLVQDIPAKIWVMPVCKPWRGDACSFSFFDHPYLAIGGFIVTAFCLAWTMHTLKAVPRRFPVRIEEVKSIPNDLINYVFPYIVSFMGLAYGDPSKIAGFSVFLFVLFLITYRSGQIFLNPMLIVLGWRFYEVKMKLVQSNEVIVARVLKKGLLSIGEERAEAVQDVYIMGDI